ncbi:PadR family transcriptional regulator [Streptomyces sp. GMY02]|uniref:PadR family transcriptional regulator n=1 Tax=Streptomyces sp. GMY02 TaxID=1333528 RepID=UPI001C2C6E64|nr:PadR family transcriptional regulator [Streptomyces sp. GMY02]QXE35443.1 PadR family transcriptional regulator [Streptomyces sp. GMY02]
MPSTLPMSGYVVLGLLSRHNDATPYQLDQNIRQTIGHFWAFPRSQLYAEAARLVRRGLVIERQEEGGRRRRTLSLTDKGRHELQQWLAAPTSAVTEIHDEGLLRLYFQPLGGVEDADGNGDADSGDAGDADAADAIGRLATEQIRAHEGRLAVYQELVTSGTLPSGSPQKATLELGLRFERLIIDFWHEVAASSADLFAEGAPEDG